MPDHRQKKLAKKRRKRANVSRAGAPIYTDARGDAERGWMIDELPALPVGPCFITRGWMDPGVRRLHCVVATRKRDDGIVVPVAILLDLGCMGVRDAYVMQPTSVGDGLAALLAKMTELFPQGFEPIRSAVASALVHKAIAYAAELDLHPPADALAVLSVLDENREPSLEVEFGRRGKPLYTPLPGEDTRPVVQRLVKAVGPDGFEADLPSK